MMLSCVLRALKNSCSFKCLDLSSLHYTSLNLHAFTSLGMTSFHLSSLQMLCHVKCSEVNSSEVKACQINCSEVISCQMKQCQMK